MRILIILIPFLFISGCAFQKPACNDLERICSQSDKSKGKIFYCLDLIEATLNSIDEPLDNKIYALSASLKAVHSIYYRTMDNDLNAIELRNKKFKEFYEIGKELFYNHQEIILSDTKKTESFFDFFNNVIFSTNEESPLIELESIFNYLAENRSENKDNIESLYNRYVQLRFFTEAKAISLKYKEKALFDYLPPEISEPKIKDNKPKYYSVGDNGNKLELITPDINQEKLIIGIISAGCGASQRILAINNSGNEKIAKAFKEYGLLLNGQYVMDVKETSEWNKKHPDFPTYIIYKEKDNWPDGLQWGATPSFFFFKNGKLVYTTVIRDPYLALIYKKDKNITCEKAFIQSMQKGIDMLEM